MDEPLAASDADAGGGRACWRRDADWLRDGTHLGVWHQVADGGLAELRVDPIRPQLGAAHDGGGGGSPIVREVGSDERQAHPARERVLCPCGADTGCASCHSDVASAERCDVDPGRAGAIGVVDGGQQHHIASGRCSRDAILCGPGGPTGVPPGSISELGEEGTGRVCDAGVSHEPLSTHTPAPGIHVGGEQRGGGGGESVAATPVVKSKGGRPAKRRPTSGWGGVRSRARVEATPESQARAIAQLKSEVATLGSQLRRKESDGVQAVRGEVAEETRQLRLDVEGALKAAALARSTRAHHAERVAAAASAKQAELEAELLAVKAESRQYSERVQELTKERGLLRIRMATKDRMIATREEKLAVAQEYSRLECEALNERISDLESKSEARLTTIRQMMGRLGGRPVVNRGEDELADCNTSTAQSCTERMAARLVAEIGQCSAEGAVSADALMRALRDGGWMPTVWESEIIWEWRMDWLREKSDDLRVVWTPEQTMRVRDKLSISMDKLDDMRYEFSHYRVGKKLHPRPWVINPWSNARVNFPQPIAPRCGAGGWHRLVKLAQEKWGLRMDATGRVAQRSFREVVSEAAASARCGARYCAPSDS